MDRFKIAARIRALLAKTVENGCTEEEAIAAAAKAGELLARYNLTIDEVQMRETPFRRHQEFHEDYVGERLWKVADAIAHLTGVRYWTSRAGVIPIEISFFGFDHEVEVARYLLEICARAMRQEHLRLNRQFALLVIAARRRKVLPFLDGMVDTLSRRIKELKPPDPVGKGLMVLRSDLIDRGLADLGLEFSKTRARQSRDWDETYRAGKRAGDRVALNRGVGGRPRPSHLISGKLSDLL